MIKKLLVDFNKTGLNTQIGGSVIKMYCSDINKNTYFFLSSICKLIDNYSRTLNFFSFYNMQLNWVKLCSLSWLTLGKVLRKSA